MKENFPEIQFSNHSEASYKILLKSVQSELLRIYKIHQVFYSSSSISWPELRLLICNIFRDIFMAKFAKGNNSKKNKLFFKGFTN